MLGKTEEVQKINLVRNDFTFCVELPIKAKRAKLNLGTINCYERKRIAGVKRSTHLKMALILIYMIKIFLKDE